MHSAGFHRNQHAIHRHEEGFGEAAPEQSPAALTLRGPGRAREPEGRAPVPPSCRPSPLSGHSGAPPPGPPSLTREEGGRRPRAQGSRGRDVASPGGAQDPAQALGHGSPPSWGAAVALRVQGERGAGYLGTEHPASCRLSGAGGRGQRPHRPALPPTDSPPPCLLLSRTESLRGRETREPALPWSRLCREGQATAREPGSRG